MGIFDIFRSPKAKAKRDLKKSLKDAKWAKDYNDALKDLGVNTNQKVGAYIPGYNYNYYSGLSTDSGGAKWPYGLSADGRTRTLDHYSMRQNARDAYHDSIDARAIANSFSDDGIGTGLVLDATPLWKILGITQEAAEEWSDDVNSRFHLYQKDKKQHRSGLMNLYQYQRLYAIFQQRDNDMYSRLFYSNKKTLQSTVQFQEIDPNQIRGYSFTNTMYQYNKEDGIIRNPDGTEKAYRVWIEKSGKEYEYKDVEIKRIGEKSGKVMMIHGFNPEYAGQKRGYSRLGFALQELENITDFSLATIKKAINQSNLLLSVENQQQDSGNPFEGMTGNTLESAVGRVVTADPTTEETTAADRTINVCPIPEAGLDVPGSTAFVGNSQGDTVRLLQNTTPTESYREFVGAFLERLAAAAGTSVEVVLKKFGENYSASRATLVLVWRNFQIWREEMAQDFLNVIYEAWLSEEIAAGRISAPGFSDPRLRAAWLNNNWIGSRMPDIDPAKTAKAAKDNLEMNLTTLEREARNLNGSSAKDNIMKNAKDFDDLPTPPWSKGSSTPGQAIDDEFEKMKEEKDDQKEDNESN